MDPRSRSDSPAVEASSSGLRASERISTRRLFAPGETEIRIDHDGTEYRLRITRSNKLILFR
jgi:hemin uptake protein HemP